MFCGSDNSVTSHPMATLAVTTVTSLSLQAARQGREGDTVLSLQGHVQEAAAITAVRVPLALS